jgi:beta-1,4-galactosyltransferase 4
VKLSVIIPYRDRLGHLRELLPVLVKTLHDQGIDFRVVVAEQVDALPFNRGRLVNAAFLHEEQECSHVVIHDVDMVPVSVDYSPCRTILHMAGQCSQFGWKLPYPGYFGGVTMFARETFRYVNGFSNWFFGWGGEDDHLRQRCVMRGFEIHKYPGKFLSLPHDRRAGPMSPRRTRNRSLLKWLASNKDLWAHDGLSDIDRRCAKVVMPSPGFPDVYKDGKRFMEWGAFELDRFVTIEMPLSPHAEVIHLGFDFSGDSGMMDADFGELCKKQ